MANRIIDAGNENDVLRFLRAALKVVLDKW